MHTPHIPNTAGTRVDFDALRLAQGPGLQAVGLTERVLCQVTVSGSRGRV